MSALHIFDMDGTLLRDSSGPIEISRRLGRLDGLLELERRWARQLIDATQFARAAIDPARILHPADKVRLADTERRSHGLATAACVAYGDSVSDLPLFERLDNTVAINADAELEAVASVVYRGDTLVDAYAHGRALLAQAR